jgi:hypothetical protein
MGLLSQRFIRIDSSDFDYSASDGANLKGDINCENLEDHHHRIVNNCPARSAIIMPGRTV